MKSVSVSRSAAVGPSPAVEQPSKTLSIAPFGAPSWAPSKLVVADRGEHQRDRAGHVAQLVGRRERRGGRACRRRTSNDASRREHPEVDREGLAALDPLLDPEQGHHAKRVAAVDERGDRDRRAGETPTATPPLTP